VQDCCNFPLEEIGRMFAAKSQGRRGWGDFAERNIEELDARTPDARRAKS
jgi:hypothetical protein